MPPVSDIALTDLNTLKGYLKIPPADTTQNVVITALIFSGTSIIKRAMNRPIFLDTTIAEEKYSGNGNYRLFLNTQPVISIATIIDEDSYIYLPYNSSSFKQGYRFDKYGIILFEKKFYKDTHYTITYDAGYAIDSEEAFMGEQALLSLCNLWWKRSPHIDEAARSLGGQVTAKYIQDEFPPETKAIINQLKRVV
jgi:hypothetical protein